MNDARTFLAKQQVATEHLEGFFAVVRQQLDAQHCERGLVDFVVGRLRQAIDHSPLSAPLPAGVTQAQADQLLAPLLAALQQFTAALILAYIELWGHADRA